MFFNAKVLYYIKVCIDEKDNMILPMNLFQSYAHINVSTCILLHLLIEKDKKKMLQWNDIELQENLLHDCIYEL